MAANSQLTRLINETVLLTKRPDLVDATKQAVKSATLKMHTQDYFYRDIKETGVSFSVAAYQQSFEYKRIIPNFRALKYVRKVVLDSYTNTYEGTDFLEIISPEVVLDNYRVARENVAYPAGQILQIRSSTQESLYLLGCYVLPNLTDESYESWIADDYESAIVYDAAATVFKGIGYDEQSAQFRNDAAMWMKLVANSNINIQGM